MNIFDWIIIKLCENVCWQNILAKFDNQPDPIKHIGVMALELAKFAKINRVTCIFLRIIIKLCEHVCLQNISAKFDNQPYPIKHLGVMALELAKFAKINRVRVSNLVIIFVGTLSPPHSITSEISLSTLELWPLLSRNCSN